MFGPVVPPPSPAGSRSSGTCRLLMFRCVARYVTRTTPPLRRPPRLFERASLNLSLSLSFSLYLRLGGLAQRAWLGSKLPVHRRSSARTTRQTWLTSASGIRSWQERLRMVNATFQTRVKCNSRFVKPFVRDSLGLSFALKYLG